MTLVEIYSKEGCHLCDVAKEAISRVREQHPFELQVIMMDEQHERYEEFKERVPVIFINRTFAFQYRVNEAAFIRKLSDARGQDAVLGR